MGKRYYCEFCERAFQDNKSARKRHLQSNLHKQHRSAWYNQFKDKRQKLEDELAKPKICSHYAKSGFCSFGDSCRYRHLTIDEIADAKNTLNLDSTSKYEGRTVETWLLQRNSNFKFGCAKCNETANTDVPLGCKSKLDKKVASKDLNLAHMPPSLQAPPENGWGAVKDLTWG